MYNGDGTSSNWYSDSTVNNKSNKSKYGDTREILHQIYGIYMNDYVRVKYKIYEDKVIITITGHNINNMMFQTEEGSYTQAGNKVKVVLRNINNNDLSITNHLNIICKIIRMFAECINVYIEVDEPLILVSLRSGYKANDSYKDLMTRRSGEVTLIYNKKEAETI